MPTSAGQGRITPSRYPSI